jgi:hypothetical protein
MIDAHLGAAADRLPVTEIAARHAVDSGDDPVPGDTIVQAVHPAPEDIGLDDLDHEQL